MSGYPAPRSFPLIPRYLALPAVLLMTGALATPALAAKQTIAFTAVKTSKPGVLGGTDRLVNAKGKVIGHDAVACKETPGKKRASCTVVFKLAAPKSGSISGKFTIKFTEKVVHGTITGGTGGYAGATGTITATPGDKTKVVLTIA